MTENKFAHKKIMMMAGGTGGHVYPALAVAEALRMKGAQVYWMGNKEKFEGKKVPACGFELFDISVTGLRGNGVRRWIQAPWMLSKAILQARKILKMQSIDLVIGMGGFASGPGGIAAKLLGIPLVIHEQNAVMGMTNKWLSKFANLVLLADGHARAYLKNKDKAIVVGNPLYTKGQSFMDPQTRYQARKGEIKLLILGGSQGARAINELLPQALALIDREKRPMVTHQTGSKDYDKVNKLYGELGVTANVVAFSDEIYKLYAEHDWVFARSGAMTVAEITAIGLAALFIPYPYAVDDHQTMNARFLVEAGAADLIQEKDLNPQLLADYILQNSDRQKLSEKAALAAQLNPPDALGEIIHHIERIMK